MRRTSRRSIALVVPIALLTIAAPPVSTRAQSPPVDDRPNILVIVTDDQRVDTMSVMPRTRKWMEDGGVEFTHAYANTPLCCPARASIFSGRYAHNHGVESNELAEALDTDLTMQAYLQRDGYRTGIAGKYLNKFPLEAAPAYFEKFAVRNKPTFVNANWNIQGRIKKIDDYDTDVIRRHTFRFLNAFEKTDGAPWFLYLAPIAPHVPATTKRKYSDTRVVIPHTPAMHEDDISDKPDFIQSSMRRIGPEVRNLIRRQYRSLLPVDDLMRSLMRRLQELRERRRTLVIFVSDNGFLWRDHGLKGKTLPYIPSAQVPMYLRWPGRVTAGTQDPRLTALIDIAPTILDAAGSEADTPMDGRSLVDASWDRDRLLLEHGPLKHPAWTATITHDLEYVEWDHPDGVVREYYDLIADPWQFRNLFGDDDALNDPDTTLLSLRLNQDAHCSGTEDDPGGGPSCP